MALTVHASQTDKTQTPYKIDPDQTLRASQALLKHVQAEVKKISEAGGKKNLLAANDSDDEVDSNDAQPIWLNLTTKYYIVDKHRLKPSKIRVPHSLNTSENGTICLITTDPQRTVKNVVADLAFPSELSMRITSIIGLEKLLRRYKSFEQRRQLRAEHDVFLADARIVARLPKALGKVFYKGAAKRPIPVDFAPKQEPKDKNNGPSQKKVPKDEREAAVGTPTHVAKEIQKALDCVPVSLSPGFNISVRVALDSFTPSQLQDNITAVANGVIEKNVVNGWKNVKSIHIKTNTSVALPIWLAEDLWTEETKPTIPGGDQAPIEGAESEADSSKKRKRRANGGRVPQSGERKKARMAEDTARDKQNSAARHARVSAQKTTVFAEA